MDRNPHGAAAELQQLAVAVKRLVLRRQKVHFPIDWQLKLQTVAGGEATAQ